MCKDPIGDSVKYGEIDGYFENEIADTHFTMLVPYNLEIIS